MEHKPNEPSPIKPTNLFLGNHNLYKYKPSKTLSREHHTKSTKKKKEKKNNKSIWVISKCMKDIEKLSRMSTCVRERPREMKSTSISLPPLKH